MSLLDRRAQVLLDQGLTPLRAFRKLKQEFPSAEHLDLKVAVGQGPTGITPWWAERSGNGRSVVIRNDPRKFEEEK